MSIIRFDGLVGNFRPSLGRINREITCSGWCNPTNEFGKTVARYVRKREPATQTSFGKMRW